MATIVHVIILFILLGLFVLMSYLNSLKPKLEEVEAGQTSENRIMGKSRKYNGIPLRPQDFVNGKPSSFYKQFVVEGNCMAKRNIAHKDIILVELFKGDTSDEDKLAKIKENDILLIYLDDIDKINNKGFKGHKIRGFKGRVQNNTSQLDTFYYDENGEICYSTKPHKVKDVMGIVRMKLQQKHKYL